MGRDPDATLEMTLEMVDAEMAVDAMRDPAPTIPSPPPSFDDLDLDSDDLDLDSE